MRPKVFVLAVLAALAVVTPAPQVAVAAGPVRDIPVVFVHGLDPFEEAGYPCPANWGLMRRSFREWGWTADLVGLKYYAGDTECQATLDGDGRHDDHFGHDDPLEPGYNHALLDPGSHGSQTPIEHLGYHLAWYLYDHFSRSGQTVDLVGHSMGGLIIRYALTEQERRHPDFPPYLYVANVVTLETPHAGTSVSRLCFPAKQCREMVPGSRFLRKLDPHPQGTGGTEWTVVGSLGDELVPARSAVDMAADLRMAYQSPSYEHSAVLWDTTEARDAVWSESDRGGVWTTESDRPHSVRLADVAAAFFGR